MGATRKAKTQPEDPLAVDWAREVERARMLVHDLRNPIGAISMAAELLRGPLAKVQAQLDPATAKNLRETLEALHCSVEQAVHLVRTEHGMRRTPVPANTPEPAPAPAKHLKVVTPAAQACPESPPKAAASRVDVSALLRKLEILVVTRSSIPALLAIQCATPLWIDAQGAELLRALSNLVENAIEASAAAASGQGPWTVDLACELDKDGAICFRVSNEGSALPKTLLTWLAHEDPRAVPGPSSTKSDGSLHGMGLRSVRAILEGYQGSLSAEHKKGVTTFQARLPASRVHTSAL